MPTWIVNFDAESHVDRSIDNPKPFLENNRPVTYVLFEAARRLLAETDAHMKTNSDFCTFQRMRCVAHSGQRESLASRLLTLPIHRMLPQKVPLTILSWPIGIRTKFQL